MPDLLSLPPRALASAFGTATALRGERVFHPRGRTRTARLVVAGGGDWGAAVLDRPGVHEGVARLSRGAGLPPPLPDVEGLALRLHGLGAGGGDLDLLINTAWRYAFVPTRLASTWSSLLPYVTGSGRQVLVGARPSDPDAFVLLAAPLLGRWRPWGRLELGADVDGEGLRFDPTGGADDLVHTPFLRELRARSYRASQAARQAGDVVEPVVTAPPALRLLHRQ